MERFLKIIVVVITIIITITGSLIFTFITLLAAIKNWGAFKNCDNTQDDFIEIEDYD